MSYSFGSISILDLGYTTSSSPGCKLIASAGVNRTQQPVTYGGYGYGHFKVQATPDGMGLTIYTNNK